MNSGPSVSEFGFSLDSSFFLETEEDDDEDEDEDEDLRDELPLSKTRSLVIFSTCVVFSSFFSSLLNTSTIPPLFSSSTSEEDEEDEDEDEDELLRLSSVGQRGAGREGGAGICPMAHPVFSYSAVRVEGLLYGTSMVRSYDPEESFSQVSVGVSSERSILGEEVKEKKQ